MTLKAKNVIGASSMIGKTYHFIINLFLVVGQVCLSPSPGGNTDLGGEVGKTVKL